MQTSAKFCEVFALKISFRCPQTCSALFVGRASTFIIFRHNNFFVCIFASESRQKNHDFKLQVHERKGHSKLHCSLTRYGKYCECHPAHSFQFIIIMGDCRILLHQSTMPIIYCVWCFHICDVVVVKSLYIAFLVHKEQFAFPVHALRITIKFDFWGTLGGFLLWNLVLSMYCVIKQIADRESRLYQNAFALMVTTSDKVINSC